MWMVAASTSIIHNHINGNATVENYEVYKVRLQGFASKVVVAPKVGFLPQKSFYILIAFADCDLPAENFFFLSGAPRRIPDSYHKRSNVETTFHMIKAKFGQRHRSKTLTAQINEALCKVLCHNLCIVIQSMYELGVDPSLESQQLS